MDLEPLKERIRLAFAESAPFQGPVTRCDCEECSETRLALSGRRWQTVSPEFLKINYSPALIEAEALAAFLPAYLLNALDGYEVDEPSYEFMIYSLCPTPPKFSCNEKILATAAMLTASQREVVRDFIRLAPIQSSGAFLQTFADYGLEHIWR